MFVPTDNQVRHIVLHSGEWHFGREKALISTTLGSCVSMVIWHPATRIGGMSHFMLAGRSPSGRNKLDARYSDDAFELLLSGARAQGITIHELKIKIFGGAMMLAGLAPERGERIGLQNVNAARRLASESGIGCLSESVGGNTYLQVHFETWSGDVWAKRASGEST